MNRIARQSRLLVVRLCCLLVGMLAGPVLAGTPLLLEAGRDSYRPYAQLLHFCMAPDAAPEIDAVRTRLADWPWRPQGEGVPNRGFRNEVCWYRLPVENRSHPASEFILGLDYPLLTLVDVWQVDQDGLIIRHYREGADLPYSQRRTRALGFAFGSPTAHREAETAKAHRG